MKNGQVFSMVVVAKAEEGVLGGGEWVAWGKRSKLFNKGSGMKMARENRSIVLRFCWLVGMGWVGLERESWRLRFFGEKDCQEILMSKPYDVKYRLGFNRPPSPPLAFISIHMYTYENLYSCSFYTFRPLSPRPSPTLEPARNKIFIIIIFPLPPLFLKYF